MDGDGDIVVFGDPIRVVHVPSLAERVQRYEAFVAAWDEWRRSRDDCITDGACAVCDDLAVLVDRTRAAIAEGE